MRALGRTEASASVGWRSSGRESVAATIEPDSVGAIIAGLAEVAEDARRFGDADLGDA